MIDVSRNMNRVKASELQKAVHYVLAKQGDLVGALDMDPFEMWHIAQPSRDETHQPSQPALE